MPSRPVPSTPMQAEPGEAEQQAITRASSRVSSRRPRFSTQLAADADGRIAKIGPDHADQDGWMARLQDLFGTRGTAFAISQLNHVLGLVKSGGQFDRVKANALLAVVEAAEPANEVEAALALQMAITHEMALQALARAQRVDQIGQYDSAGNMAVKLLRTYMMQLEALARLRRGGEQVVRVVHVHPGAQAVVGTVVTGGPPMGALGRGGCDGNGNQPHAKALDAAKGAPDLPEMRGDDASRNTVPIASRASPAPLPHARRIGRKRRA